MHPEQIRLDASLERAGQDVVLRRAATADVTCRAKVAGYRPDELVGGVIQGDRSVIISNTEIENAAWPGPPRKGDIVMIAGKQTTAQSCETVRMGTDIIRHNLQVRG